MKNVCNIYQFYKKHISLAAGNNNFFSKNADIVKFIYLCKMKNCREQFCTQDMMMPV